MSSVSYLVLLLGVSEAALLFGWFVYGFRPLRSLRRLAAGRWLPILLGVFVGWLVSNVAGALALVLAWDWYGIVVSDADVAFWGYLFVLSSMALGAVVGYRAAGSRP